MAVLKATTVYSDIKPLGSITRILKVSLTICIAVFLASTLTSLIESTLWSQQPVNSDPRQVTLSIDRVSDLMTPLRLVSLFGLVALFLAWVFRATKNLRLFTDFPMSSSPWAAVFWYLVPVFNWVKPYFGMKEIWQASHCSENRLAKGWIVGRCWWSLVLLTVLADVAFFPHVSGLETVTDYTIATRLAAGRGALEVVLVVVTLIMVTRVGRAYSENVVEVVSVPPGREQLSPLPS